LILPSSISKTEFPALDGVRGASRPSIDAVYEAGVAILIEGIAARFGVK